jgi:hypothetical protein
MKGLQNKMMAIKFKPVHANTRECNQMIISLCAESKGRKCALEKT